MSAPVRRSPRQAVTRPAHGGGRLPAPLPRQAVRRDCHRANRPAVARTCPAHHVRRDRAQAKPERHRANGRGDRNAAADRDGREPSGRSERHGGRLPLRSWRTVRRTVATASRPARSGTAHRVRTRHRPAMCPHRVRLMADRPADGGEIGTPAPLPRRTVAALLSVRLMATRPARSPRAARQIGTPARCAGCGARQTDTGNGRQGQASGAHTADNGGKR